MQTATKMEPSLRLPAYVGHWRDVRLCDFLIPTFRAVPKPKDKFLAVGIRSHCRGTFQRESLDPEDISMDTLYVVKEGDLIVNITFAWEGAIAIVKAADDGGLVSHRFPTYVFNEEITGPDFFQHVFVQGRFRYFLKVISPGGAGRNRVLDKKDFLKLAVRLPERPEQEKIAAFISAVDERIGQLARKKGLLFQYKQGVMQQIFDRKIRFKDGNGNNFLDWELRPFEELFVSVPTKKFQILSSDIASRGVFPVIDQGQNLVAGYFHDAGKVFRETPVVIFGDHTAILKYVDFGFVVGADGTKILKPAEGDPKFLYYALVINNIPTEGYKRHFSILKSVKLMIPKSIDEQITIASFLSAIDEKINVVDRQLEITKKFKKGILQLMFV
jgi:type I restriction enzyme S subunit